MGKILFWVLMLLIFLGGIGVAGWPDRRYIHGGVIFLIFLALVILGLKVFGFDF